MRCLLYLVCCLLCGFLPSGTIYAQTGEVKGFVFDAATGEPLDYANVAVKGLNTGVFTGADGYYAVTGLEPGTYTLECTFLGYDTAFAQVSILADKSVKKNLYIKRIVVDLAAAGVTANNAKKKKEQVDIGKTSITARQLLKIPTVGGSPDLVQYLQVLPGVVTSGDQGGQLYIRGGSPVMNKVLLDGMTIYNPFHSIGLFSVFDADIIKSADVYSAGFGAEYGGRVSAVLDVKTRDGNKNRISGTVAVNPFMSKVMLEGPLRKFRPGQSSSSFIVSVKNSYLEKSSKIFYNYADPARLP